MENYSFVIDGGRRLAGEIELQGSKNSVLPILAATILTREKCTVHNCPRLSDVEAAIDILSHIGCRVKKDGHDIEVDASGVYRYDIPPHLMREMRSSVIFLDAVLGRMRRADLTYPGGCELGPRPIDLHLSSLRKLGAEISEEYGHIICSSSERCSGVVDLSFPSVGATENIMLFSALSEGKTVIVNAAKEPEIADLQIFLNKMGARISGAGSGVIEIEGAKSLHSCEHSVIPDRIALLTYMCAAAITGGEITVHNADLGHVESAVFVLLSSGCAIESFGDTVKLRAPEVIRPVKLIRTMPYPGFPTDAQAIFMAYLTLANGTSTFVENIFESRYRHTDELAAMGADLIVT